MRDARGWTRLRRLVERGLGHSTVRERSRAWLQWRHAAAAKSTEAAQVSRAVMRMKCGKLGDAIYGWRCLSQQLCQQIRVARAVVSRMQQLGMWRALLKWQADAEEGARRMVMLRK